MNFQACTARWGPQGAQALLYPAHVRKAQGAEIDHGAGALGDEVDARAAFDDVGVHADAAAQIVPPLQARDLMREFVYGVDAFLRREPGVRGAPLDDNLRLGTA